MPMISRMVSTMSQQLSDCLSQLLWSLIHLLKQHMKLLDSFRSHSEPPMI